MAPQLLTITTLLKRLRKNPDVLLTEYMQEATPSEKKRLRETIKSILCNLEFTSVLTDTGLITEHSFLAELFFRLNSRFFPPIYKDNELRSFTQKLNSTKYAVKSLQKISPETLANFFEWIFDEDDRIAPNLLTKMNKPLQIIAARLVYYGTSRQIDSRLSDSDDLGSCFLNTETIVRELIKEPSLEKFNALKEPLQNCLNACVYIRSNKLNEGISLEVTYRIIKIKDLVTRIEELAELMTPMPVNSRSLQVAKLVQKILSSEKESQKISTLFYQYIELVFYEITEHTGKAGESYITDDKIGYRKMLKKGLIGGLVVGLFALMKPIIGEWNLAPAINFLGYGSLYSGIFLVIYFVHGVLATKQPAMTASKIAKELDQSRTTKSYLWGVSEIIRNTFRTQFIAIFGNFIIALPAAAGVYWILKHYNIFQLEYETASYLVDSLHPLFSFTLFYAALTGVALAASGIFAGAARNWYVFNHVHDRLIGTAKHYRWIKGPDLVKKLDQHLEGFAGNISLGFLLGFLSVAGDIIGLPINVRHITFASAQAGTGLIHFANEFTWPTFSILITSIVLVGLINLSVSFGITFFVVFKSRKMTFHQSRELLQLCFKRFLKEPLSFFLPPKN